MYDDDCFVLFPETGSEEFNQFISLLGNRVRLKGWDKYRGGLDVKGDRYTPLALDTQVDRPSVRSRGFHLCFSVLYYCISVGDMTGEYSAYTIYEGHEIMFHVSTMLPYSKDNRQQVIIGCRGAVRGRRGAGKERIGREKEKLKKWFSKIGIRLFVCSSWISVGIVVRMF